MTEERTRLKRCRRCGKAWPEGTPAPECAQTSSDAWLRMCEPEPPRQTRVLCHKCGSNLLERPKRKTLTPRLMLHSLLLGVAFAAFSMAFNVPLWGRVAFAVVAGIYVASSADG